MATTTIRMLAATNNGRGDLFTSVVRDFFFSLGYEDLQLNVHKTGREIDVQGQHRHEIRRVIGECKAQSEPVGGADINKFLGALVREQASHGTTPVSGYFVSLNGFTESAIEQEKSAPKLVLVNGSAVLEELIRSRVVIAEANALAKAYFAASEIREVLDENVFDLHLCRYEGGYVWAAIFSTHKVPSHFALIHADGTTLAVEAAHRLIALDQACGGTFDKLIYLAPKDSKAPNPQLLKSAMDQYARFLAEEYGYIQLDGLPADTVLSSTRMKLERLFVPLRIEFTRIKNNADNRRAISTGRALRLFRNLAILSAPGGGKSTVIKRIVTAFAIPERHGEVKDGLPKIRKLPLVLKCRELRDRAHLPIREIVKVLTAHACLPVAESDCFQAYIDEAFQTGQAILLVDGLDEISDEGARKSFVGNLRTFTSMFPAVSVLLTSREAGFRVIAGMLTGTFQVCNLAPLTADEVTDLCVRWHAEVISESEKVRQEAEELARTIWHEPRIRTLAENPLLLTTLLVVKRWIGELPRNRAALYAEAVKVLVRTWNVEGYDPLDEEETLAQLSYVACHMQITGKQQVKHRELIRLLEEARKELEAELQYATISAQKFIERIEYRSSVLMQAGHATEAGRLEAIYEFRHLTFQEYLAARGFSLEQYKGRDEGKSLAEILEPYLANQSWREVIPLAAVLAGRKAEPTIQKLISNCLTLSEDDDQDSENSITLNQNRTCLERALIDEVQVTSSTLRHALLFVLADNGKSNNSYRVENLVQRLWQGKLWPIAQEVIEGAYLPGIDGWEQYSIAMSLLSRIQLGFTGSFENVTWGNENKCLDWFFSEDRTSKIKGTFCLMFIAYSLHLPGSRTRKNETRQFDWRTIRNRLELFLLEEDMPLSLSAAWALAWIGKSSLVDGAIGMETMFRLIHLWREYSENSSGQLSHFSSWAFGSQPFLERTALDSLELDDFDDFLQGEALFSSPTTNRKHSAYVLGWYRRRPWTDEQLTFEIVSSLKKSKQDILLPRSRERELLERLGEPGRNAIAQLDSKAGDEHENGRQDDL